MLEHYIKGFIKAAAQRNITEQECLVMLKQADMNTDWLPSNLTSLTSKLRSGLNYATNEAPIWGAGGTTAGDVRDTFSALNPFGANGVVDYFTNFGGRMDASKQNRNFDTASLKAELARNNMVAGNYEQGNTYAAAAQDYGKSLTDPARINQIGDSLNTARNVNKGLQLQDQRLNRMNQKAMSSAQNRLAKPITFGPQATKQPIKKITPPASTNFLKDGPSQSMRKPLFSMSPSSNVKI